MYTYSYIILIYLFQTIHLNSKYIILTYNPCIHNVCFHSN